MKYSIGGVMEFSYIMLWSKTLSSFSAIKNLSGCLFPFIQHLRMIPSEFAADEYPSAFGTLGLHDVDVVFFRMNAGALRRPGLLTAQKLWETAAPTKQELATAMIKVVLEHID